MARVTVEDCIKVIPNTFELVLFASQRARELGGGNPAVVTDDEKPAVIALREIAGSAIDPDRLREALVSNLQHVQPEEDLPEGDELDRFLGELGNWAGPAVSNSKEPEPPANNQPPEPDAEILRADALENTENN